MASWSGRNDVRSLAQTKVAQHVVHLTRYSRSMFLYHAEEEKPIGPSQRASSLVSGLRTGASIRSWASDMEGEAINDHKRSLNLIANPGWD